MHVIFFAHRHTAASDDEIGFLAALFECGVGFFCRVTHDAGIQDLATHVGQQGLQPIAVAVGGTACESNCLRASSNAKRGGRGEFCVNILSYTKGAKTLAARLRHESDNFFRGFKEVVPLWF